MVRHGSGSSAAATGAATFVSPAAAIGFATVVDSDSDGTGTLDSAVGVALFTGVSSTTGVDSLELLQPIQERNC